MITVYVKHYFFNKETTKAELNEKSIATDEVEILPNEFQPKELSETINKFLKPFETYNVEFSVNQLLYNFRPNQELPRWKIEKIITELYKLAEL